jgi:chromosome segregation ATPase
MKKSKRVGELKSERMDLEFKIKERVQADYNDKRNKQLDLQRQVANDERDLRNEEKMLAGYEDEFERLKANKETLIKEWREINARQLVFDDNAFVCPTCGRQLEIDDIERKQGEMTEKFNARKAADLEANNRKGQAMKQRMTEVEASISGSKMKIGQLEEKIAKEKANELYTATLTAPDATPAIEADAEYQRLTSEIEVLEKELAVPTTAPDTAELSEKKKQYAADIDEIKTKLAKRDTINRTNQRISELETQLRNQSDELSSLEGIEFTMAAFAKAKIEAVESRINHLFSIVRFKMFETQINGGEVETCEATVDGVPYSDLNNAMKINAGLDIINAICGSEGVTAPIFIDNAESINELMPTQSQMIRLVVTEDDTLIIQ